MLFSDPGRDPDFLCVGTQRAGTTWLAVMLGAHPGAWMPPFKEISFWYRDPDAIRMHLERMYQAFHGQVQDRRVDLPLLRWWGVLALSEVRDIDWYRSLFSPAGSRVTGDITPQYALLDDAQVARVSSRLPDAKVILMLRHPVERAWSQLRLDQRLGRVALEAPRAELEPAFERLIFDAFSLQGALHARWRAAVGDERLCVVFHDEIVEAPERAFVRVCDHLGLGVPGTALRKALAQRVNHAPGGAMPDWLRSRLSRRYLADTRVLGARFPHPVSGWLADMEAWAER